MLRHSQSYALERPNLRPREPEGRMLRSTGRGNYAQNLCCALYPNTYLLTL